MASEHNLSYGIKLISNCFKHQDEQDFVKEAYIAGRFTYHELKHCSDRKLELAFALISCKEGWKTLDTFSINLSNLILYYRKNQHEDIQRVEEHFRLLQEQAKINNLANSLNSPLTFFSESKKKAVGQENLSGLVSHEEKQIIEEELFFDINQEQQKAHVCIETALKKKYFTIEQLSKFDKNFKECRELVFSPLGLKLFEINAISMDDILELTQHDDAKRYQELLKFILKDKDIFECVETGVLDIKRDIFVDIDLDSSSLKEIKKSKNWNPPLWHNNIITNFLDKKAELKVTLSDELKKLEEAERKVILPFLHLISNPENLGLLESTFREKVGGMKMMLNTYRGIMGEKIRLQKAIDQVLEVEKTDQNFSADEYWGAITNSLVTKNIIEIEEEERKECIEKLHKIFFIFTVTADIAKENNRLTFNQRIEKYIKQWYPAGSSDRIFLENLLSEGNYQKFSKKLFDIARDQDNGEFLAEISEISGLLNAICVGFKAASQEQISYNRNSIKF